MLPDPPLKKNVMLRIIAILIAIIMYLMVFFVRLSNKKDMIDLRI